jgi:2-haloacid dehalogenase
VRQGAPWRSADDLNAAALAAALADGPALPEAAVRRLGLAVHRLRPWPDSRDALRRLAERFTVVALSNGNLSMLTDLFAAGGLTWHGVLSGEMVQACKPDPVVYQLAVEGLDLDPRRTLMVAAHRGTCAPPPPTGCAPLISSGRARAGRSRATPST